MVRRFFWDRRHYLSRMQVDIQGWRHPRPPSDPRLVLLSIGMGFVACIQTIVVRPDTSVSAQAFTTIAAIAVAFLTVVSAGLMLRAGFCKSQFSSWGYEIGACIGYAGQSAIQLWALISVNPQWWATSTLVWTAFWGTGNIIRCVILVRRVW